MVSIGIKNIRTKPQSVRCIKKKKFKNFRRVKPYSGGSVQCRIYLYI